MSLAPLRESLTASWSGVLECRFFLQPVAVSGKPSIFQWGNPLGSWQADEFLYFSSREAENRPPIFR